MPSKVKITVIRRGHDRQLIEEYLKDEHAGFPQCDTFKDGQEFVVEKLFGPPEGFCPWAWADIRQTIIRVATGSEMPSRRHPGVDIAGCTDWFRPVLFRIERINE